VKRSLHNRASTICQERQNLINGIISLRLDLQLNGYPQGFVETITISKGNIRTNKEENPLGSVYIPYAKGVSENFRRIANRYKISTISENKHTLRSSLMKTRL
jgi:hypothetical protein